MKCIAIGFHQSETEYRKVAKIADIFDALVDDIARHSSTARLCIDRDRFQPS